MSAPAAASRRESPFQWISALRQRFRSDRSGMAVIEFGLLAIPFFTLITVMFEVSMLFLTGQALDTSVDEAARQLLTGQAQTSSGSQAITNMATFKTYALCPRLPAIITCSQVQINVAQLTSWTSASLGAPVSGGTLNTASWGYQPCTPGQIMKVEAAYPMTAWTTFWTPVATVTISGTLERVIYTSTVFKCEQYS